MDTFSTSGSSTRPRAAPDRASVDYQLSTGRMPKTEWAAWADQPGTPLQPLPARFLGDLDSVSRRHDPAYPPELVTALVD